MSGHQPCQIRCVTFDDPGLPEFWRAKAFGGARNSQYWRDRVVEYLTFPNPINTTLPHFGHLVRVDLATHSRWAPALSLSLSHKP